jgi:hypothetical protein
MNRIAPYEAPKLEIFQIVMERGFAQSLGGNLTDYTPSTEDSLDD